MDVISEPSKRAIEQMLTHPDSDIRAMGRLMLTDMPRAMAEWVQAEDRRGTSAFDLMAGMVNTQAQMFSSLLLRLPPHLREQTGRMFAHMFGEIIQKHLEAMAASERGEDPRIATSG
jgi:hypothetical protein